MKTKIAIAIGALAVLGCLGFLFWKMNSGTSSSNSVATQEVSVSNSENEGNVDSTGTSVENGGVTAIPM